MLRYFLWVRIYESTCALDTIRCIFRAFYVSHVIRIRYCFLSPSSLKQEPALPGLHSMSLNRCLALTLHFLGKFHTAGSSVRSSIFFMLDWHCSSSIYFQMIMAHNVQRKLSSSVFALSKQCLQSLSHDDSGSGYNDASTSTHRRNKPISVSFQSCYSFCQNNPLALQPGKHINDCQGMMHAQS